MEGNSEAQDEEYSGKKELDKTKRGTPLVL